jgi:hypothetical protein
MRARRTSAPDRRDGKGRRRAGGLLARRARPSGPSRQTQPETAPRPREDGERDRRPASAEEPAPGRDLFHERRLRESGGPEDVETYTCSCGFVWEAPVTASVTCPHCGAAQAW